VPSQKQSLGAQRGKALHGITETYLLTPPEPGSSETLFEFAERTGLFEYDLRHGLRSASEQPLLRELRELQHTPDNGVEILVEQEFDMSPVFMGFIDLVILDRRSGELQVTLRDHKFTGDKRYVPTEEKARVDYQTIIYAKALLEFFSLDSVDFSYDYYGTKYKWQKFLKFTLTREFVNDTWLKVIGDTQRVLNNYTIPNGARTTPNYLSCQNYGGCEFKELCFGESK
jgi:hypothetical protein